ncbi:MAG: hypothetical protein Alpg2KO_01810 [Alphaproteobacteria bacterium]
MKSRFFAQQRKGASLLTYGLLVGLIAVAALVAVNDIGGNVQGLMNRTGDVMGQARTGGQMQITLSANGATSVPEGDSGTTTIGFTLTRTGSELPVTISWQVSASGGTSGDDFAGGSLPSGSTDMAEGQSTAAIEVDISGDALYEGDESFALTITGTSRAADVPVDSIPVTVQDDDIPPEFTIAAASADRNEADGSFTFTISRSGPSAAEATIGWAVSGGGSGLDGADFSSGSLPSGSITYGAGDGPQTITVTVADDGASEGDESFDVEITSVSGGGQMGSPSTASGVIRNDDTVAVSGSGTESNPYAYSDGNYAPSCLSYMNGSSSYDPYTSNGVYQIQPGGSGSVYSVVCDMSTDGGGWTVLAGDPLYDNGVFPLAPTLDGSSKTYTSGQYFARQGSGVSGNCNTPNPRYLVTVPFDHSEVYYDIRARSHNVCGGSRVISIDFGSDGRDFENNMSPCGQWTVHTSNYATTRQSPTGTVNTGTYWFRGASCQNFNSSTQSQVTVRMFRVR